MTISEHYTEDRLAEAYLAVCGPCSDPRTSEDGRKIFEELRAVIDAASYCDASKVIEWWFLGQSDHVGKSLETAVSFLCEVSALGDWERASIDLWQKINGGTLGSSPAALDRWMKVACFSLPSVRTIKLVAGLVE